MPRITRVAVLLVQNTPANAGVLKTMEMAAKSLKVELQKFEVGGLADFDGAFAAIAKKRVNAVVVSEHPLFLANPRPIADLATAKRMLSVGTGEYAAAGLTIGYGVDFIDLWRRMGYFVDKILKGAKPGDIPIEQASRFEFVVNMKTAKALGIKIPQLVLLQATKVIE